MGSYKLKTHLCGRKNYYCVCLESHAKMRQSFAKNVCYAILGYPPFPHPHPLVHPTLKSRHSLTHIFVREPKTSKLLLYDSTRPPPLPHGL